MTLIDEAASRVRLKSFTAPPDLRELDEKIKKFTKKKESAVKAQDFERPPSIRDEERIMREKLDLKKEWNEKNARNVNEVTEDEIAEIVSRWTGMPVKSLPRRKTYAC